ncbi:MAG: iron chelate uptake ABC transporter family permease subunit [Pseudomonadota bacterium]
MRYALGLLTLCVLATISIFIGVIDLTQEIDALAVILVSRIPRTLAVIIAGSGLAIAGSIMQMLVRNRFVEPMTAGTGQGAALGILLAVLVFPDASVIAKMVIASLAALCASFIFLAIVRKIPPTQPLLVPLVGLIYGGLIGAAVTFIAYQADLLQYLDVWLNGEFSGVLQGRYELLWIAAAVALFSYFIADQFSILGMGEAISVNLGLNYQQVMAMGLLTVSIVSALTVVTVGAIPFVGLVVPNIVSRLYGDNLRNTLPLMAIWGAGAVLVSDILGRLLRYPFEIPAGTMFGILGTLLFLYLLYAPQRHISDPR